MSDCDSRVCEVDTIEANTPLNLRADAKVTDEPVRHEGIETTHTFTQGGQYQVDVDAIASGSASDQDSIGVTVE